MLSIALQAREAPLSTTFRVGDIAIHRIVEAEYGFLDAFDMLPGLTPELLGENRGWMEPRALTPEGKLVLCFQSYIVRTPHHVVLVDSCIGNDKHRPTRPEWHEKTDDRFAKGLASAGLTVNDIDFVLCTHLHADHVGWNTRLENGLWVPTFPKARYVFGAQEFEHWQDQNAKTPIFPFQDSVLPVVEAGRADLVASDHAIGDHIRLLPTPGHTPGHVSVLFGRTGTDAIMPGDIIHSPLQARYPELSTKFDIDKELAAKTRRNVLDSLCDTSTLCCMAHFPSPSVGRIARWGEGFRCEPIAGEG
jgi:glyoxylase-like metal-dependent hydrolase (beta-lactamase superfamily II)